MKTPSQTNYEAMYKELVSRIIESSTKDRAGSESSLEQPSDLIDIATTTVYGFSGDVE